MVLNLIILLLSLVGFTALALGMDKHWKQVSRSAPSPQRRKLLRTSGWTLLTAALALCFMHWGDSIGPVAWLGGLSVAGLLLVFGLPKWPWRPPARPEREREERTELISLSGRVQGMRWRPWQWGAAAALLAVPVVFASQFKAVSTKPLLRDTALKGEVGPWSFTFAEASNKPPNVEAKGSLIKAYQVRFCETCDEAIRHVYLKVNKPRSLRSAGMSFAGARWDRSVEIQLPGTASAESELWLTVVGKDGSVHEQFVRLSDASPATVAWLERRQGGRR